MFCILIGSCVVVREIYRVAFLFEGSISLT